MNYTTLVADLQTWLQDYSADFVAAIPDIVRQVEDRIYHAVQLPAWRSNAVVTTTAASRLLSLPNDAISLSSLAITDALGQTRHLLFRDVSFIGEAFPDQTLTGTPRVYAMYDNGRVMLGPTPSTAFSVEVRYFAKPASIIVANNTWVSSNAESVLFYGCLSDAYVYLKGESELQGRYRALHDEGLARLKDLGEGKLKRDDFRMDKVRV